MRTFERFGAIAAVALFCLSQQAVATVLYSQPSTGTGNIWGSQDDTSVGGSGNFGTAYDNFTLTAGATVSKIDWTGGFFNPSQHATIDGFVISIYANASGVPGASLYSETISGNAGETFVHVANNNPIYNYTASADFTASAGVEYWLSIVPMTDGAFPQWGWQEGSGGDGSSYQVFDGVPHTHNDLAFTLATPLPAALPLFASGVGALSLLGWRRKRKAIAA
jgi:hypothetical protein